MIFMSEGSAIILTGEVLPGHERANVIAALVALLKIDEPKAASLLAGRETLIKRNVAIGDVDRYIRAFTRAGAASRFKGAQPPASSSLQATASAAKPAPAGNIQVGQAAATGGLTLAPAWSSSPEEKAETPNTATQGQAPQMAARNGDQTVNPYRASSSVRSEEIEQSMPVYSTPKVLDFSTAGRIGRLRYMAYYWPTMGLLLGAGVLLALLAPKKMGFGTVTLGLLVLVFFIWSSFRVMALRLHDLNRSGKWVLLPFLLAFMAGATRTPGMILFATGLYWVIVLAMLVWPGSSEDNDYGPPAAPNSNAVYVGALAFILLSVLGALSMNKYNTYLKDGSRQTSKTGSSAMEDAREAMIQSYAQRENARTPVMMNAVIRLDKVEYADKVLHYKATLMGRGINITDDQRGEIKKSLQSAYCGQDKQMKFLSENKIVTEFDFKYQITNWDYETFTIRLAPEKC